MINIINSMLMIINGMMMMIIMIVRMMTMIIIMIMMKKWNLTILSLLPSLHCELPSVLLLNLLSDQSSSGL